MIVACLALTVALGQTSYATVSLVIPHDSVGTKQLKDGAVTTRKVRKYSLHVWNFARNSLPSGPAGPPGPQGPQGSPGVIGDLSLREDSIAVPGNETNGLYVGRAVQVMCQPGEKAITGGTKWSSDANQEQLVTAYSRPVLVNGIPVGWRARGATDFPSDRVFTVEVLCAR
jgi:hypothetical protein